MNGKRILRWLAILIAIPLGGFWGLLVTDWLWHISGRGNSHGDVANVLGSDVLGVLVGALLIPYCLWHFTRRMGG